MIQEQQPDPSAEVLVGGGGEEQKKRPHTNLSNSDDAGEQNHDSFTLNISATNSKTFNWTTCNLAMCSKIF